MSQVAKMSDAPETLDEARAVIDQLEREVDSLRSRLVFIAQTMEVIHTTAEKALKR